MAGFGTGSPGPNSAFGHSRRRTMVSVLSETAHAPVPILLPLYDDWAKKIPRALFRKTAAGRAHR